MSGAGRSRIRKVCNTTEVQHWWEGEREGWRRLKWFPVSSKGLRVAKDVALKKAKTKPTKQTKSKNKPRSNVAGLWLD